MGLRWPRAVLARSIFSLTLQRVHPNHDFGFFLATYVFAQAEQDSPAKTNLQFVIGVRHWSRCVIHVGGQTGLPVKPAAFFDLLVQFPRAFLKVNNITQDLLDAGHELWRPPSTSDAV